MERNEKRLWKIDKAIENIEKKELEIIRKLEAYEGQVEKRLVGLEHENILILEISRRQR